MKPLDISNTRISMPRFQVPGIATGVDPATLSTGSSQTIHGSFGNFTITQATRRKALGNNINIRAHNLSAIESHPMSLLIDMIQGSAIDPDVVA
jgi:hypothetical protein